MKVRYQPSGYNRTEIQEFADKEEFEEWEEKQKLAEWIDCFCHGRGDGTIDHLQIEIIEE